MEEFKVLNGKGYDWKTFIYIMQDNEGCKFGITNNIERRQKQYKKERPSLKLKYCKPLENRNIARLIEYNMRIKFPIISGRETTSATLIELIDFIESSNTNLDEAMLELNNISEIKINKHNPVTLQTDKSYSLDDKRIKHPNAYMKWTKDDDNKLESLFCQGKSIKELCEIFERNNGAIRSRIKKLELKEKYSS
ncbi:hypothetical protein [Cellulophaga omnivescoria]|uniref:hypothetical protein n=1 Tax=Cellulophaga omnivescoria TaxID=1888890 RepID=UPI000985B9A7|nr:hypothetical protein [Cellulophaga omnivescoria]